MCCRYNVLSVASGLFCVNKRKASVELVQYGVGVVGIVCVKCLSRVRIDFVHKHGKTVVVREKEATIHGVLTFQLATYLLCTADWKKRLVGYDCMVPRFAALTVARNYGRCEAHAVSQFRTRDAMLITD